MEKKKRKKEELEADAEAKKIEAKEIIDKIPSLNDINNFFELNKEHFTIEEIKKKEKNKLELDKGVTNKWIAEEKEVIRKNISADAYSDKTEEEKKHMMEWAERYIATLEKNYVSWTTLDKQMKALADDVIEQIEEDACQTIYFLVPGGVEKSATWIFFVLWKYIKDRIPKEKTYRFISRESIGNVDYELKESLSSYLADILYNLGENNEGTWCFLVDDMAYSGAQSLVIMNGFNKHTGNKFPKNFYVTMPYISDIAKLRLLLVGVYESTRGIEPGTSAYSLENIQNFLKKLSSQKTPIKFFESTEVINSMEVPIYTGIGTVKERTVPIVLNSKIADEASILQAEIVLAIPGGPPITEAKRKKLKEELMTGKRKGFFKGWELIKSSKKEKKNDVEKLLESVYPTEFRNAPYSRESATLLKMPDDLLPLPAYYKEKVYTVNGSHKISNKKEGRNGYERGYQKGIFPLLRKLRE